MNGRSIRILGLFAALATGGLACEVPPVEVAAKYVVAREHGYGREAYGLLSRADRDVRAYRDFRRRRVKSVERRVDRLLARTTDVRAREVSTKGRGAQVAVEIDRVDVNDASRQLIARDLEAAGTDAARRLRRAELPVTTSTETIVLVREPRGWRVFLDLEGQDETERRREVARLRRLGQARMRAGDYRWAIETYETVAKLLPGDRDLEDALKVLRALTDKKAVARRRAERARAYRPKVAVSRVRVRGREVFGEVRNQGDQGLDRVEITVVGLDRNGVPIVQTKTRAVDVDADGRPLPTEHARRFRATFDEPPEGWTGAVEVEVTEVRLTPHDPHGH